MFIYNMVAFQGISRSSHTSNDGFNEHVLAIIITVRQTFFARFYLHSYVRKLSSSYVKIQSEGEREREREREEEKGREIDRIYATFFTQVIVRQDSMPHTQGGATTSSSSSSSASSSASNPRDVVVTQLVRESRH